MCNIAGKLSFTVLVAAALCLAGCGGSSSDVSAGTGSGSASGGSDNVATLSGVVFAESECANVPVSVIAANGVVLTQVQADSKGNYTASYTNPPANPAMFVSASCPSEDGSEEELISLIPPSSVTGATVAQTVNLNQLANFLSALVTNSKDPTKLVAEVKSGVLTIDAKKQTAAREQLTAMLLQVVKAAGLSAFDPVSTPVSGKVAIAQLLETVNIQFIPQSDGNRTVQIRLKLASIAEADGEPVFQVTNVDLADVNKLQALIKAVSAVNVSAADLVPSGTNDLINDLVRRMNLCVATPFSSDPARGPLCNAMFVDSDFSKYFNDGRGLAVLTEQYGYIEEIYYTNSVMTISAPSFEYLRPNGIIGFTVQQQGRADLPKTLSFDASRYTQVRPADRVRRRGN